MAGILQQPELEMFEKAVESIVRNDQIRQQWANRDHIKTHFIIEAHPQEPPQKAKRQRFAKRAKDYSYKARIGK